METNPRQRTPFQRYLESIGDEQAAVILQCRRRTVKSWRLGDRTPRPEQARDIIARLPVTFDDIYGSSPEDRAKALEESGAALREAALQHVSQSPRRRQMG